MSSTPPRRPGGAPPTPSLGSTRARGGAIGQASVALNPVNDGPLSPGTAPGRMVRPYALTGGRTRSATDLPIETIVVTTAHGAAHAPTLVYERRRIAELCEQPISVAEVAAHIDVPLGVARVLVGDLAEAGMVEVHRPQASSRPDLRLLERVLGGIRAL